MSYWLYVLRSHKDGKTYTGSTGNLKSRLQEHFAGKVKSTRNRRPLELVLAERFQSRHEAVARERYFKTAEGGVEKQRLIRVAVGV